MELGGGIRMNYILGTTAQVAAGMAWFRGSVFAWQARWRALALAVGAALMFAAIAQGLFMDLGL